MNPSIVDYLNTKGKDSSFSSRTALANQYGIQGYKGTAEQNTQLLSLLRKQDSSLNAGTLRDEPTFTQPQTVAKTSKASTSVLDLTAGAAGLLAQQQNILGNFTKELDTIKTERAAAEKNSNKFLGTLERTVRNRPSQEDLLADLNKKYGIDEAFSAIQGILPEVTALRENLVGLEEQEALAIEELKGQGRGIPTGVLGAQEGKIVRTYAIRKAAVSAQLGAKAATMEALRGNISTANQLAANAVEASLYDYEQKLKDYKDLYTFNREIVDNLDDKQREILSDQVNILEKELTDRRKVADEVARLMVDNPRAGIQVTDTLEQAAEKIVRAGGSLDFQKEQRLKTEAGKKEDEFGSLTASDEVKIINFLETTPGVTDEDRERAKTDRGFQAWILKQLADAEGELY